MTNNIADRLNTSIQQIGAKFEGGLSNTSTKKFDDLIQVISEAVAIDVDDIYITSVVARASNVWNRLSQGKPLNSHFKLGVCIATASDVQGVLAPMETFIGDGNVHYDSVAVIVEREDKWQITDVVTSAKLDTALRIRQYFPSCNVHIVNKAVKAITEVVRIGLFSNLEEKFEKWLPEHGVVSAASKYVRNLKAISEPIEAHSAAGKWNGFYEALIGVPPSRRVFDVSSKEEFLNAYENVVPFFEAEFSDKNIISEQYANQEFGRLFDYIHAAPTMSGISEKDGQFTRGGFRKFMVFLDELEAVIKKDSEADAFDRRDVLAAIRTKPFILLAGISGTGKSRLVRQLARGCCPGWADAAKTVKHPFVDEQKPGNFEIIAVRPNWHDSTELMGFESRIPAPTFVIKPFVEFLVKAWMNPDIPFFLCLDEMNLAPVEQYFAEYLSAIESRKEMTGGGRTFFKTDVMVKMGAPEKAWDPNGTTVLDEALKKLFVPYAALLADPNQKTWAEFVREMFVKDGGVSVPPNLVVMGTVNMDETTCSFSRKVLDRAMSFELNDVSDMYDKNNLAGEKELEFGCLGQGVTTCTLLTGAKAYAADNVTGDKILAYLKAVNDKMEGTPFKIAYRSRNEIMIYCLERVKGGIDLWKALDEATSMKILSRIEGDEQKFIHFKLRDFHDVVALELCKIDNPGATKTDADAFIADPQKGGKSVSLAKLQRMAQALADGAGFVSFWE